MVLLVSSPEIDPAAILTMRLVALPTVMSQVTMPEFRFCSPLSCCFSLVTPSAF